MMQENYLSDMLNIINKLVVVGFVTVAFSYSTNSFGQETMSFETFKEQNSWYISETIPEKIADPKNNYGSIDFRPENFDEIPFQLSDSLFQFFIIKGSLEVLVLKPLDLLEEEFKKQKQ